MSSIAEHIQKQLDNGRYDDGLFLEYCHDGNLEGVKYLVETLGVDINAPGGIGNVCLTGQMHIFDYFLSKGVNMMPEPECLGGFTTLICAVMRSQFPLALRLLPLITPEYINQSDSSGQTAVHNAVRMNSLYMLKHLVSYGADLNKKDKRGKTPIMIAEEEGFLDIVDYIKDHFKKKTLLIKYT